jgi:hypothetical protein
LPDQKKVTKKNQGKKIPPTAQAGASRLFAGRHAQDFIKFMLNIFMLY